jgi:hypothetical protein
MFSRRHDTTYGRDFARYVAEFACGPWSQGAAVDCLGVGREVEAMNRERV